MPTNPNHTEAHTMALPHDGQFSARNSLEIEHVEQSHASPPRPLSRPLKTRIDEDSRYRAIIKHLYARASSMSWMSLNSQSPTSCEGVLIRKSQGEFVTEPQSIHPNLLAAVKRINPGVTMTMSTDGTQGIFDVLERHETELIFQNGSQMQVFDSMADVAKSSTVCKFQYAALLRQERLLLVWQDDLGAIISHAMDIKSRILALVWGTARSPFPAVDSAMHSRIHSRAASTLGDSSIDDIIEIKEKDVQINMEEFDEDLEKAEGPKEFLARPLIFTSSIFIGLAMLLIMVLVFGLGNRQLILETMTDHFYPRLLLALTEPIWLLLEIPKIWKRFKWMYLGMFTMIGGMIYLGTNAPHGWDIKELTAVLPYAVTITMHCLLPIALNPSLTVFNY